jgi:hypothetical protein
MADLEMLLKAVDELSPEELHKLYDYVEQKRRTSWWVVPPEKLAEIAEIMRPVQEEASSMAEEEINEVIDEAIAEVRRERKQN